MATKTPTPEPNGAEPPRSRLPAPPRNIRIVVEYDGRAFAGWEKQKTGIGVQQVLEDAILRVTGEKTTVNGAGRTDAGVHAIGQVANFTLKAKTAENTLYRALNAVLPAGVAIVALDPASLRFHARFSATGKHYRYTFLNDVAPSPLLAPFSHHIRMRLDLEAMRRAAAHLVGVHDFAAFAKDAAPDDDTVRRITAIELVRDGRKVELSLYGDGFLYNMVRIIAGTLLAVGMGRLAPDDVRDILIAKDRSRAGQTLPPAGLCLVEVYFDAAPGE